MAVLLAVFFTSCQKEDVSALIEGNRPSPARKADVLVEPTFYNVIYATDNGDVTVAQYLKRARKNLSPILNGSNVLMKDLDAWARNKPTVVRQDALGFVSDVNNPSFWPVQVNFIGKQCIIYRGGNTIDVAGQYKKYTNSQGQVMVVGVTTSNPTGLKATGPSFNVNPNDTNILNYGGAYKIRSSIPSDLTFIQQGQNAGYYVLVPKVDMLESTYISRVSTVTPNLEASF